MGTSASRGGQSSKRGGLWTAAKRHTTSLSRGTGSSVKSAVGNFVAALSEGGGAHGGAGRQSPARTGMFSPSVSIGQSLGGFLSGVGSVGLDETLRSSGLANLIGKSPGLVLSGIVDYLCGEGGVLDKDVARSALIEIFSEIFEDVDETYVELKQKWEEEIDKKRIQDLISLFLSQSIFQRFLSELGDRIESNAISVSRAEQLEKEILGFIKEMINFELGEIDPFNFNWQGKEGKELIQRNLEAACSLLEQE